METVEVVIRIPKEVYEKIQKIDRIILGRRSGKTIEFALWNGVRNGTILPKGYRRLIDANDLSFRLNEAQIEGTDTYKGLGEAKQIVDDAPTIIGGIE